MSNKEKLVLVLDSSQLDCFDNCPTHWHYQYEEGLVPNNARSSVPMDMGTYGHKLLEIFYKEISHGKSRLDAMELALDFDIDKHVCQCFHNDEKHEFCGHESGAEVCKAIGCECKDFTPIEFPLTPEQRQQVKDRLSEYCYIEGTSIPFLIPKSPDHVEVGFSKKIYEDNDRLYILEGRIDLIGQIANNVEEGWADHKFQLRETSLYTKTFQFRNYCEVLQLPLGVINYIRLAKKFEPGKTFKRDVISFSRQEIDWWRDRLIDKFQKVEMAVLDLPEQEGNQQWYQENDALRCRSACSGKFGYPCPYTTICENSFNPQFVRIIEQTDYQKRPVWRPW